MIGSFADPTGSNRGLQSDYMGQHSGRHNIEDVADFMIRGTSGNHRVGQGIARAGDINEDGLEAFFGLVRTGTTVMQVVSLLHGLSANHIRFIPAKPLQC